MDSLSKNMVLVRFLVMFIMLLSFSDHHPFAANPTSSLDGGHRRRNVSKDCELAAHDFGNMYHHLPSRVVHPETVSDISSVVKRIFHKGKGSNLTVAARGHAHSVRGQAQALRGVVITMESLKNPRMHVHAGGKNPYIDVSGGERWINVLHESLKHGLSPRSWTDYLHVTVGGTLSNGGVSGQSFRYGPQTNNVYQLEVVTGKGEVVKCSKNKNADLFHGVLGGLGQFGIITRARIPLEPAPKKVKWIRVLYADFSVLTKDQEHLISLKDSFDYVEGLVIINKTGLQNNWRSTFDFRFPLLDSQFNSEGKTFYSLEVAKYIYPNDDNSIIDKKIKRELSKLNFIPSTFNQTEESYVKFLDRVYESEVELRAKGLWHNPHPWMDLLIPQSQIGTFASEVFDKILTESYGPILVYPMNKSKWIKKTSLVLPDEDVFYLVAFLFAATPNSTGSDSLKHVLSKTQRILDFCNATTLGMKQYVPHHSNRDEWKAHFGTHWDTFVQRKLSYDPLAILAPGQGIFGKAIPLQ